MGRGEELPGLSSVRTNIMADEGWVLSVDLFRGVVMFLLIGKVTGLYDLLAGPAFEGTWVHALGLQFRHHPWHGLRLWDLGQPFFLFISGVAMVYSYGRRFERGESRKSTLGRALRRSFLLVVLGWALYLIGSEGGGGGFKGAFLFDILPQLGFASLIAFFLLKRPAWVQISAAAGLVALTELLYRFGPGRGPGGPFVPGRNFGAAVDTALFGAASEDGLVTFNMVPATAFAVMGLLAARMLRSGRPPKKILLGLAGTGLAGVAAGLALDPLTPVVRPVSTSSFVLVCGGLAFLSLALGYWLIDVMRFRERSVFFVVVGMNPVFIYIFALSGGGDWLRRLVAPFTMAFSGWVGEWPAMALTSFAVWGLMWGLCCWLYRRKIFIRV
jgi:predicted acyltransferase